MGSKSNFAAIFSVLPCFHARILPHFQVKPLPTLRFKAEISTVLYYSVITITSTTIINLLQPPLHWSVIESLFEINYLLLPGREGVTIFCTQSIWFLHTFFFCNRKQIYKHFKPHFHVNLTKPVFAQHVKDKACAAAPHYKTIRLRASSYEPSWPGWRGYRDEFCLGFIWEISAQFPRWEKVKDPGYEFWRQIWETKQT